MGGELSMDDMALGMSKAGIKRDRETAAIFVAPFAHTLDARIGLKSGKNILSFGFHVSSPG